MFRLCEEKEIPEGSSKIFIVNGEEIAVFHTEGRFFALSNVCPHQGGPLGEGEIEGYTVTCPWHGWKFDLRTGNCVAGDEDCPYYEVMQEMGVLYLKNATLPPQ